MKRIHDIFDVMVSVDTLRKAFLILKAKRYKKHKKRIERFEKNLEKNLLKLHKKLIKGIWKMHKYKYMVRREHGKLREIWYSSNFGDLVVQCAIGITLGALLNKSLINDTYAGIPGKSIHKNGVRKIFRKIKAFGKKSIYGYKLDIHHFYASIDHNELKKALIHKIKDKCALALLFNIIDNCPLSVGIPIGNFLSPIFANFFLNTVDRFIKCFKFSYYRYNDDMLILSSSKDKLHVLRERLHKFVESLKLHIKKNEQIYPIERFGFDFIGFVFQRNRVLVRRRIEGHVRYNAFQFHKHPTPHRARTLNSQWGYFKRVRSGENFWVKNLGCTIKTFNKMQEALCS